MYRDDPLDDEVELRAIVGDDAVDALLDAEEARDEVLLVPALDVLRILQGWVDDEAAGQWFHTVQRRLDGETPLAMLAAGALDEVLDAARAWAAAQG